MTSKRKGARKQSAVEVRCVPQVSRALVLTAFFISFALPNLVYSGTWFFSALHLMKWATALLPVALLGVVAGWRVLRHGAEAARFRLDGFAVLWLLLLVYTTLQPLWTDVRSMTTFYREWFFFASLWLVYALAYNLADERLVRALLWGALANAALNVLFAELQMRGMATGVPLIALSAPGNYIGNTGQQNMFAFWMTIAGIGGSLLMLSGTSFRERPFQRGALLALTGVVFWGLIASTSRSGILSLLLGVAVMSAFYLRGEGRRALSRVACVALLFAAVMALNVSMSPGRSSQLLYKMEDMVTQPLSIANRDSIWATSWTMFARDPWRGVGLGQFKWHYIDANNLMKARWPHLSVNFTMWAHNEFLQWMAEGGVPGALLMFALWGWWGISAGRAFFKRRRLSPEAIWGCSLVTAFFFNALWTRPFHRIENALWLSLAFAVANREVIGPVFKRPVSTTMKWGLRVLGGMVCGVSLLGVLYLADGIRGDRLLRLAAEREKGNASAVTELYRRAYSSLMVRDLVEKHTAYFSIELGKAIGNKEMVADGLNTLVDHFRKQPHVEDLGLLLNWAYTVNNPEFRRYIESFVYASPKGESADSSDARETSE